MMVGYEEKYPVLEMDLAAEAGLSQEALRKWREKNLRPGTDYRNIRGTVRLTQYASEKLRLGASLVAREIKPPPFALTEEQACGREPIVNEILPDMTVTRHFRNDKVVEARSADGTVKMIRIHNSRLYPRGLVIPGRYLYKMNRETWSINCRPPRNGRFL